MAGIENAEMSVENGVLTIKVNLDQRLRASSSGKNLLIATGSGPIPGGAGAKVSLSVYTKDR